MTTPTGTAWTAGQVARHLGIAESTLRTWHRRYGLGPRGAEPGRYRRYLEEDVARLRRMQDLISLGMLASEAARRVQEDEAGAVPPEQDTADLVAAARALDTDRCRIVLDNVFARRGVVDAWELVSCPALQAVDTDQRQDPDCIDVEHALSWTILAALHRIPRPPVSPDAALVLLACVENEQHTLPLAALSAALAEHRVPSRMLGAATPTQSLVRAVRETRPVNVVLWAQQDETASPQPLRALRPFPVHRIIAGPGWPGRRPPGTRHVRSLHEALAILAGPLAGSSTA
ncbi:MAG TPA: MerR family transcriptional regulator [Streptosporangiaceae bacterium]|nr:MerR family transcriptional regulator [Streptosporangiaceae bacterium]